MTKAKTTTKAKSPKTIKVKTLVIAIIVLLGLIASFIAGMSTANSYNAIVHAKASELAKELKP